MSAELATLAADPARIADVTAERLPALIGEAEALRAALWARLQTSAIGAPAPDRLRPEVAPSANGRDRLLTAAEVAEVLGVTRRWVYRKASALPFTRRLSGGTLRFSQGGLERWQSRR